MLKVGLTGGIGSGKSTIAKFFTELGVPHIDADIIARDLVKPGKPTLSNLLQHFGEGIINSDGTLDRKTLRDIVFSNPEKKRQLESILHPLVYQEIRRQTDHQQSHYVIISIPLLIETNMQQSIDRILVVDCPVEIQFARVAQRDHLTRAAIQSIIDTQSPREQRLAVADDIIDSNCSIQRLAQQVKNLHNSYLALT